jgi:Uma2 family endonuclease
MNRAGPTLCHTAPLFLPKFIMTTEISKGRRIQMGLDFMLFLDPPMMHHMSAIASQPRTARFTPDDLLRLPDGERYELIDGQLVERCMSVLSSRVGGRIYARLAAESERTGDAVAYPSDLGYLCFPMEPGKVRRADASVIRKTKLVGLPADQGYMTVAADLAVEVISPNDLSYDVREKVENYLNAGFGVVWVVYPNKRIVDIHRANQPTVTLREPDEITADPVLPEFRCRVADFFAE